MTGFILRVTIIEPHGRGSRKSYTKQGEWPSGRALGLPAMWLYMVLLPYRYPASYIVCVSRDGSSDGSDVFGKLLVVKCPCARFQNVFDQAPKYQRKI